MTLQLATCKFLEDFFFSVCVVPENMQNNPTIFGLKFHPFAPLLKFHLRFVVSFKTLAIETPSFSKFSVAFLQRGGRAGVLELLMPGMVT